MRIPREDGNVFRKYFDDKNFVFPDRGYDFKLTTPTVPTSGIHSTTTYLVWVIGANEFLYSVEGSSEPYKDGYHRPSVFVIDPVDGAIYYRHPGSGYYNHVEADKIELDEPFTIQFKRAFDDWMDVQLGING